MPLGRQNAKILLVACLVIAALLLVGCSSAVETPAAEATPSPEPVIVSVEVADLNNEGFGNMPSPTPSPEPTPTPLPFSYYAPTVNMTYEELVGSTDDMGIKLRYCSQMGFPTRRPITSSLISSGRLCLSINDWTTEQRWVSPI